MEHRHGQRTSIHLPVSLWQGGEHLGWFTTKDMSMGGMSLKGGVKKLADNSIVSVLIEAEHAVFETIESFKALVIHQSENSIGLMLIDHSVNMVRLLPQVMELAA